MSHDDFAFEPIPGLPGRPPKGELILWQGRPAPFALLRDAFGLKWVLGYFAVLAVWRVLASLADGGIGQALLSAVPLGVLAGLAVAVLYGMAVWTARSTIYTLTTARVAMKVGIALPVTFNVPFAKVGGADLDLRADGSGTIALRTTGDDKIAYLIAWPHVRPWHLKVPQPAMRCVAEAETVAQMLSDAWEARRAQPQLSRAAQTPAPTATPAASTPDRPALSDVAALAGLSTAAPIDPAAPRHAPSPDAVPAE